jgi:hypothetical protein
MLFAAGLSACSQEIEAKKIDQCVDVCKACMKGNTVTCNTSCRLRGAS